MGLFCLVKGAFRVEDIPGAAQEKEVEIAQRTLKFPVEIGDVLVEDIMAARVEPGGIDGAHECNGELTHTAGHGRLF